MRAQLLFGALQDATAAPVRQRVPSAVRALRARLAPTRRRPRGPCVLEAPTVWQVRSRGLCGAMAVLCRICGCRHWHDRHSHRVCARLSLLNAVQETHRARRVPLVRDPYPLTFVPTPSWSFSSREAYAASECSGDWILV